MSRLKTMFINLFKMTDLNRDFPKLDQTPFYEICDKLWSARQVYGDETQIYVQGVLLNDQMKACAIEKGAMLSHYLCSKSSLAVAEPMPSFDKVEYSVWYDLSKNPSFHQSRFVKEFHQRYPRIQRVSFTRPAPNEVVDEEAFLAFLNKFPTVTHLEFFNLGRRESFYEQLCVRVARLSRSLVSLTLLDDAKAFPFHEFDFLSEFHSLRFFRTNLIPRSRTPVVAARLPTSDTLKLCFSDRYDGNEVLRVEKEDRKKVQGGYQRVWDSHREVQPELGRSIGSGRLSA